MGYTRMSLDLALFSVAQHRMVRGGGLSKCSYGLKHPWQQALRNTLGLLFVSLSCVCAQILCVYPLCAR